MAEYPSQKLTNLAFFKRKLVINFSIKRNITHFVQFEFVFIYII